MQDRYVGDIGDFGKYGLLDFISSETKLKLGVNWCLTSPTQNEMKSDDGKFYDYLLPGTKYEAEDKVSKKYAQRIKECDEQLYKKLQKIVIDWLDQGKNPEYRCTMRIEDGKILPTRTIFYSRGLNKTNRTEWLNNGIQSLSESELIFFDPDNGIADGIYIKDVGKSPKHIYCKEIRDYFENGQSLVIYQHANRSDEFNNVLKDMKDKLIKNLGKINDNQIIYLRYKRGSARAFFIIMQQKHSDSIEKAVDNLLEVWKGHFERSLN